MKRMRSSLGDEIMPVFLKTSPIPSCGRRGSPWRSSRFTASANFGSATMTFQVPSSPGVL